MGRSTSLGTPGNPADRVLEPGRGLDASGDAGSSASVTSDASLIQIQRTAELNQRLNRPNAAIAFADSGEDGPVVGPAGSYFSSTSVAGSRTENGIPALMSRRVRFSPMAVAVVT